MGQVTRNTSSCILHPYTVKEENQISSYTYTVRKFKVEQLQVIYEEELPNTVCEEMRKYFTIYEEATAAFCIS